MSTLLLWEGLCIALLWSVFCRLIHVDKTTKPEVRTVVRCTGLAAILGIGAPIYGWEPDTVTMIIMTAVVSMEIVLSQNWKYGIPSQFILDIHRPKRRAEDHS